jgi:hypothetical protein
MGYDTQINKKLTRQLEDEVSRALRAQFPTTRFSFRARGRYVDVLPDREIEVEWEGDPRAVAVRDALAPFVGREHLRFEVRHREPCSRCRRLTPVLLRFLEPDGSPLCWECDRKAKAVKAGAAEAAS